MSAFFPFSLWHFPAGQKTMICFHLMITIYFQSYQNQQGEWSFLIASNLGWHVFYNYYIEIQKNNAVTKIFLTVTPYNLSVLNSWIIGAFSNATKPIRRNSSRMRLYSHKNMKDYEDLLIMTWSLTPYHQVLSL